MLKFLLVAISTTCTFAGAIYVPPGLAVGDTYRIVFVTDDTIESAGETDATFNVFVTADAENNPGLAALNTTWTALASDALTDALVNAGLSTGDSTTLFYNTQGQLIAAGVINGDGGLYDSGDGFNAHSAAIYDPNGNAATTLVWTGTHPNGTTDFFRIGAEAVAGNSSQTNNSWTAQDTALESELLTVYGVSGVLTVTAPEPSTLATSALAGALLAVVLFRRRT